MTPGLAGLRLPLPALLAALLVVAGLACAGSEQSAPAQLDLASDDPLYTITLPGGRLLSSVAQSIAAGDFNGDGAQDLLIGAPAGDGPDGDRPGAGQAYVLLGPLTGDVDFSQEQPGLLIFGALEGDALGSGVAAGDLNGDGIDDIVVGAPNSNALDNQRTDMGEAYVVLGRSDLPAVVDTLAAQQDFTLQPAEGFAHLGISFAVADVNGDSIADLVAGAPYAGRQANTPPGGTRTTVGEVYIVYGRADFTGVVAVARDAEDVRLSGLNEYDEFGSSVAAADVNGDGVADIVVGASGYDGTDVRGESGGVFVFYGGSSLPRRATLDEADLRIVGADATDGFGTLVAARDLNGDGRAELIAGSPAAAGPGNERFASGEVLIVNPATVSDSDVDPAADGSAIQVHAPTSGELMPSALAVSADGSLIAIGSSIGGAAGREGSGWVYLLSAPTADQDLSTDPGRLMVQGASGGDGLGAAVAFADADGDGVPELLVLAAGGAGPLGGLSGSSARIYVINTD